MLSRLCDKAACWFIVWGVLACPIARVACFVIFGAASVTLAAYSAFAQRTSRAFLRRTSDRVRRPSQPQISNRAAKTNRLLIQTALQTLKASRSMRWPRRAEHEFERAPNPVIAATPSIPRAGARARRRTESRGRQPRRAARAARKAEASCRHRRRPAGADGLLDDGQINGLKGRLRLTSDQVEYWPAVEAALRDVVRTQLRGTAQARVGGKVNIDTNSPEVQKLIWAAMPLLMRLREDQKSEVRKLARVIGLEQVASQI